jgi:Protein of unknown function (DUF2892)
MSPSSKKTGILSSPAPLRAGKFDRTMMYANQSNLDRSLRILVGVLMLLAGWTGLVTGVWGIALEVFGWVPLVTGLIGWCPVYALLGISTRKNGGRSPAKHPS